MHDGGYQINKGAASFNIGFLHCYNYKGAGNARQNISGGGGNLNLGYVGAESSTKGSQDITDGDGCVNMGYVVGANQQASGKAAGNFGYLKIGDYQRTTGNGSFSWGANNSNIYDYAYAMGYGVDTYETNSLNARRIWENGEALDQKYAQLEYVPPQGDLSMGSYTNTTGGE